MKFALFVLTFFVFGNSARAELGVPEWDDLVGCHELVTASGQVPANSNVVWIYHTSAYCEGLRSDGLGIDIGVWANDQFMGSGHTLKKDSSMVIDTTANASTYSLLTYGDSFDCSYAGNWFKTNARIESKPDGTVSIGVGQGFSPTYTVDPEALQYWAVMKRDRLNISLCH